MSTPERRSPRRFLRFSIRGLMLLVLLIGAPLGWIVRRAHDRRDAVAAILRSGGQVIYNGESKGPAINKGTAALRPYGDGPSRIPRWMAGWLGVDFLDTVTFAQLGERATDADLALVGSLTGLEALRIVHAPITDAGLAHLSGLRRLHQLDLPGTNVTGQGLVHLKGMTKLVTLNLRGTHVDGAGLEHLTGLSRLAVLDLVNTTHVTDEGVARLQQAMPKLKVRRVDPQRGATSAPPQEPSP